MSDGENRERDIDAAIERYRRELDAEAALAGRDLDEIEDHMRELIDELRATMPLAEAIAAARQRFGEPGAIAREHAQVRTAFGTKLSRARAWSVLALLVPFEVFAVWNLVPMIGGAGVVWWASLIGMNAIVFGVYAALATRSAWARAFVLGALPLTVFWEVATAATVGWRPLLLAELVAAVGALMLVAPWRRGEVTWAGAGLALMAPVFHSATWMFMAFPLDGVATHAGPGRMVAPVALVATLAGCAGAMLRARWAAPLSLLVAPFLAIGAAVIVGEHGITDPQRQVNSMIAGTWLFGAACAALAAVIQWRQAGSALGTLRSLR